MIVDEFAIDCYELLFLTIFSKLIDFRYRIQQHSLCFCLRVRKIESNTTSDWLNRMV